MSSSNNTDPRTAPTRAASEVLDAAPPDLGGNLAMIIKGEVDAQIATARAFPRDIKTFLNELETMACSSVDVAASCFYKLKRKDKDGTTKFIEGPSVRFAELAATAFGNMRVQGRTTADDGSYVYASGTAIDLQKNVGIQIEVRRRVTGRDGRRFSDDMIAVTANAAISIAVRNATFRVIPRALWEGVFEQTKATAVGTQEAFLVRRQKMVDYFTQKVGVTVEQVCEYLEIPNLEAMTFDHLESAIGLATGLKDGDIKIDEAFPTKKAEAAATATGDAPKPSPLQSLTEQLQREQAATAPTPPAPPEVSQDATPAPAAANPAPAPEPPPMTREEENALDLELADADGTVSATDAEKAADIAGKVKGLAGKKGLK